MNPTVRTFIICITGVLALGACQKPQSAKFRVGEKVRLKWEDSEGKVSLRMRLLERDQYWVRFPTSYYSLYPPKKRDAELAFDAQLVRDYHHYFGPPPWHDEGPFDENELEPASN